MLEAELRAGLAEGGGSVAAAVVGHDSLHGDAERVVMGDDGRKELDGGVFALVRGRRG